MSKDKQERVDTVRYVRWTKSVEGRCLAFSVPERGSRLTWAIAARIRWQRYQAVL